MVENYRIIEMYRALDEIERYILTDPVQYNKFLSVFIKNLTVLITDIIVSYSMDKLKEYSEDATYWSDLCRRVITTLNGIDDIAKVDILHFELKNSLELYKNISNQQIRVTTHE